MSHSRDFNAYIVNIRRCINVGCISQIRVNIRANLPIINFYNNFIYSCATSIIPCVFLCGRVRTVRRNHLHFPSRLSIELRIVIYRIQSIIKKCAGAITEGQIQIENKNFTRLHGEFDFEVFACPHFELVESARWRNAHAVIHD